MKLFKQDIINTKFLEEIRKMEKEIISLRGKVIKLENDNDRLYTSHLSQEYGRIQNNIPQLKSLIIGVITYLGLEIVSPDQMGWSVRKKAIK